MLLSRFFGRENSRVTRRLVTGRRLLVEALEDRRLPSSFAFVSGNHVGVEAIQGNHIGTSVVGSHIGAEDIHGNHIGVEAIQGNHIGTNSVSVTVLPGGGTARKH
jgi:hypothetical protein